MRYLDPKADLTIKRVFGEHPDLVMSLLNALLPLAAGQEITDVEYLPAEIVPDNPLRKISIVDVRCQDNAGKHFLVEIQMIWSPEFSHRMSFSASKVYVHQIISDEPCKLFEPVYSLNLSNVVIEPELPGYYHYYRLVHEENTDRVIDGLHLIFVELPKFSPHTYSEKKMQVLWLRYLTEINENTREVPEDLMDNPEVKKAVTALEESAFTDAQLLGYEKFWDIISVEKTLYNSAIRKGREEGLEKGLEEGLEKGMEKGLREGIAKGLEEGERKKQTEIARNLKAMGLEVATIQKATGLSSEEIKNL